MRVSGSVLVEICVDIAAIVHVAAQERTSLGISLGSSGWPPARDDGGSATDPAVIATLLTALGRGGPSDRG